MTCDISNPACSDTICQQCGYCDSHCRCRYADDTRKRLDHEVRARIRAQRPTSDGKPREDETTRGGYR